MPVMGRSKSWSAHLKKRMRVVYGDICLSCHRVMRFGEEGDGPYATLDHVIPLSLGGGDEEDNFQLLCNECNVRKGNKYESRVDGGPYPLPLLEVELGPIPVTRETIGKFWRLRCGLCGRLEPCVEHEGQGGRCG